MKKRFLAPLAAATICGILLSGCGSAAGSMYDATKLEKTDVVNFVSSSGKISSTNLKNVYSTGSSNVEKIYVEVGDTVKKGDLLAVLDSDSIKDAIIKQQSLMDKSAYSDENSITDTELSYNEAVKKFENGENDLILTAERTLESAQNALKKANDKYTQAKDLLAGNKDTQIITGKDTVKALTKAYDDAEKKIEECKTAILLKDYPEMDKYEQTLDEAKISKRKADVSGDADLIDKAQKAVQNAEIERNEMFTKTEIEYNKKLETFKKNATDAKEKLSDAQRNLDLLYEGKNIELSEYEKAIADAEKSVKDAEENLTLTKKNVENSISKLKVAAERDKVIHGGNTDQLTLDSLEKQLVDCEIKAPCDGIITAVKAEEGAPAAGTMFVIQDVENLKIECLIKEMDINNLTPGLEAVITCNACGEKEYKGNIVKISPTASESVSSTGNSSAATFNVEIEIDDADEKMKVGMTAKAEMTYEKVESTYAVTYDMLQTDEEGNNYVYTYKDSADGKGKVAKRISVTLGVESDYDCEIFSSELTDGMELLNMVSDLEDGAPVMIAPSEADTETSTEESAK